MTDAGRAAEWAEFLDALPCHPQLAERVLVLPGNHDVNIVDRANPARLHLPTSPNRRLRRIRVLSAVGALQGRRVRVVDRATGRLGASLAEALEPHLGEMASFADTGRPRASRALTELWTRVFPMVLPPDRDDGLGFILLNSNADTHLSFTNALGIITVEQARGIETAAAQFPRACWVIALHHHPVEYPGWRNAGRAYRHRPGQREMVYSPTTALGGPSGPNARSPAYRLDRGVWRASDYFGAISGHGGDRQYR